jgi:hypothetical protein
MRRTLPSALSALLLAACGVSQPGGGDGTIGTPENPLPAKTGPYQVVTTVDFTAEAILPPQGELVVATLRDFSTNPAHALISIADKAGVPAVGTLYGVLPGVLKDHLEGWINDEIAKVKINGRPLTAYAGDLAGYADTALTHFAVDSELSLDGDTVTHRLTALDLTPTGLDVRVPIGGLVGDLLTEHPSLVTAEGGAMTFGEQHSGLNYGEYAWQGIEAASVATFGDDVRTTLGHALNCPGIAHAIADKCVLGVCVGHAGELTSICEGGLDAIVNLAHDRMAAMRLEAFHLAAGTAHLVDADGDGVGDAIEDGTWQAELNLGLGLRHAPATFVGTR